MQMQMSWRAQGLAVLLATLVASPALAASIYTELMGPADLSEGGVGIASPGGSASSRSWTHSFSLADPSIEILRAGLAVYVADDSGCHGRSGAGLLACDWIDHFYEREEVALSVEGAHFAHGGLGGYYRELDLGLLSKGSFQVSAQGLVGDSRVVSMLRVEYTTAGTPTGATPEPQAAAVFGIGTALVGWATRRRRS